MSFNKVDRILDFFRHEIYQSFPGIYRCTMAFYDENNVGNPHSFYICHYYGISIQDNKFVLHWVPGKEHQNGDIVDLSQIYQQLRRKYRQNIHGLSYSGSNGILLDSDVGKVTVPKGTMRGLWWNNIELRNRILGYHERVLNKHYKEDVREFIGFIGAEDRDILYSLLDNGNLE